MLFSRHRMNRLLPRKHRTWRSLAVAADPPCDSFDIVDCACWTAQRRVDCCQTCTCCRSSEYDRCPLWVTIFSSFFEISATVA